MSKDIDIDYGNGMKYCERCYPSDELAWKGVHVNGLDYGYHEWYNIDGSIWEKYTGYFLNDARVSDNNEIGYCLIWDKEIV